MILKSVRVLENDGRAQVFALDKGKFGVKGRATTKNFTSVDEARTFMSQTTSEKAALGYSVKRSKFHLCSPIYS